MLVGTQLSGKTTYYRKNLSQYGLISPDFFLENKAKKMGVSYNEITSCFENEIEEYLKNEFEWHISKRVSFVLDALCLTKFEREIYLSNIPNYYEKYCIFFLPLPLEELIIRSTLRDDIYVSENSIIESLRLLEPPTISEGFDKIIEIRGNNE